MVGIGTGHIVLDGDQVPPPQRDTAPHFSAHVCYGQTADWIKMPNALYFCILIRFYTEFWSKTNFEDKTQKIRS